MGNSLFDILPALKGGDSHIWKAMSGLGIAFQRCLIRCGIGMRLYHSGKLFIQPYQATGFDDQRRIGIPVVRRRAGRARPIELFGQFVERVVGHAVRMESWDDIGHGHAGIIH